MSTLPERARRGVPASVSGDAAIIVASLLAWVGMWMHVSAPDGGKPVSGVLAFIAGWVLMLTAMMLPTERNTLNAFCALLAAGAMAARVRRTRLTCFMTGYAAAWTVYGLAGGVFNEAARGVIEASPRLLASVPQIAGAVLITAGAYQLSPIKAACLRHCRVPLAFLSRHWRDGGWGAFVMGFRHGMVCVGCCWALMAIMFLVGTMNIGWMVILTLLMFAEKVLPAGRHLPVPTAVFLCGMGTWMAVSPQSLPFADGPWVYASSLCLTDVR